METNNEKEGKKSMYKKPKRFLAGFLALLMTVTILSTDILNVVYAEEEIETAETEKSESIDDKTDEAVLEDAQEAEALENAEPEEEADDNLKEREEPSELSSEEPSEPSSEEPSELSSEDSSELSSEEPSEPSSIDESQEPTTVEDPVFNPAKEEETAGEMSQEETADEVRQEEADAYFAEVSIIPIISEADLAKLDNAAVYLTVNGESDVPVDSGEEVKLKKDQEYRVEIKNADGETVDDLTATINNSTTYTPTEDVSVIIEITETQSTAQYSNLTAEEVQVQADTKDYTVKFYDSYGNEITDLRITIKAGENNLIKLPDVSTQKIGSAFKGWEDSYYGNTYKAGSSYTVTRDVEFYEYWEEVYYDKGMYIQMNNEDAYYRGGAAVTPDVWVYYNDEELTLGTDYTVKYKNNKNAGTATMTVTGKGNFAGAIQKDVPFTIRTANIENYTDYTTQMTVIKNAKVNPVIIYNGKQLKLNKDFTISGDGLENGKYTTATAKTKLTVTGINNFSGTFDIDVRVVETAKKFAVEIDKSFKPVYGDLSYSDWSPSYTTNLFKTNKIKVYEKGNSAKQLEWGTDFQVVVISGSISEAGTFKFMVVGMGEYSGNVTKSFKISPKPLADSDIEISAYCYDEQKNRWEYKTSGLTAAYAPTGSTLRLRVRYKTGTSDYYTMSSWNYKVSYSGNKKVGTGKAKITFINDYKGTKPKTVDFTITGASLSDTYAAAPDMVYSKAGKSYVSKPIVGYDGSIIKASEYTASYALRDGWEWKPDDKVKLTLEDNESYALVQVTLTANAKGNFIGSKTITYYVSKADNSNALDLSKAKVEFFSDKDLKNQYKKIPYCGSEFYTPEQNSASNDDNAVYVKVTIGKDTVVSPSLYSVTWYNATNKGKATVVIKGEGPNRHTGDGKFAVGSTKVNITIDPVGKWVTPSNFD